MASKIQAPILWAQRKETVLVSIDLQDVKNPQINLESSKLTFSGNAGGKQYESNLMFFKEIDPQKSKYIVRPRNIEFVLQKKEAGPFWERLLKEGGKRNWLKADWNKWADEDEADKAENFDTGGMEGFDMANMPDFNSMGGTGEMGGMGGMGEDSDDDEIPSLEEDNDKKKEGEKMEEVKDKMEDKM